MMSNKNHFTHKISGKTAIITGSSIGNGNREMHCMALGSGGSPGGENLMYLQLFGFVEELTGRHYDLTPIPYPAMLLMGWVKEMHAKMTGKKSFTTTFIARKFTANAIISCQKAKAEPGYTVTPAKEAVRQTLHVLQNHSMTTSHMVELKKVISIK